MKRGMSVAAVFLVWLLPGPVQAHDVDVTSVARVFLEQIGERRYLLSIVDAQAPPIVDQRAALSEGCAPIPADAAGIRIPQGFAFECSEPLTADAILTFPWALAGVVVLATWGDGSSASAYFRGNGREIRVPLTELRAGEGSATALVRRYLKFGVEHILLGIDHLLFVLGLLLLVRGVWPVVKTVTAFTVAHSITLALAVFGYVPVEAGPVEAAIALSIVLLAREIVVGWRGERHLVHRRPWLVAFLFGLLHGLGFAGALGQLGLRTGDVPLALLAFNLGVEAGQLAFIALVLVLHAIVRRIPWAQARLGRLEPALGYALGALATLWLFERLPALWGA